MNSITVVFEMEKYLGTLCILGAKYNDERNIFN